MGRRQETNGSVDLMEATGITYRQLDHWWRSGLITFDRKGVGGSGTYRTFSRHDYLKVHALAAVSRALNMRPEMHRGGTDLKPFADAIDAASESGLEGEFKIRISDQVTVLLTLDPGDWEG